MSSAAIPVRRTQEERSSAMRRRILDATLECLTTLGYAATTTIVVAERAGVSRGAELHHFPTRSALIGAAVQHLFRSVTQAYERAFTRLPPEADRVAAAIDLLWKIYQDPRVTAVLELHVAARTDAELRAALAPVALRHHANVVRLARGYFPDAAATHPGFEALLDLVLDTLQGLAVRRLLANDRRALEGTLARIKEIAAEAISPRRC
jgi:AcrR family transcriptional regulator